MKFFSGFFNLLHVLVFSFGLVIADELESEKIVACIGDSITYGFGLAIGSRLNQSYPAQLQKLFADDPVRKRWKVKNFGINGASVVNGSRLSYTKLKVHKDAQASHPDIVVIMLGTNDAFLNANYEHFALNYLNLIRVYQNVSSDPNIFLALPLRMRPTNVDFQNRNITPYIHKIQEVAKVTRLPIIDTYKPFENRANLLVDGVHPTAIGYSLLANIVYSAIIDPSKQPASPVKRIGYDKQRAYATTSINPTPGTKKIKKSKGKGFFGNKNSK